MDSHENNRNHGGGVFRWHGKACGKAQKPTKRSLCRRKTLGGPQNRLANPWRRQKTTKKPHAGRGQETIWENPVNRSKGLLYVCDAAGNSLLTRGIQGELIIFQGGHRPVR